MIKEAAYYGVITSSLLLAAFLFLSANTHHSYAEPEEFMSDMEWEVDRYGCDYKGFDLPTSDPTLCEDACARDPICKAWTYIKPNTVQGPRPRCWLKKDIPAPRQSVHTVSGIKIKAGE